MSFVVVSVALVSYIPLYPLRQARNIAITNELALQPHSLKDLAKGGLFRPFWSHMVVSSVSAATTLLLFNPPSGSESDFWADTKSRVVTSVCVKTLLRPLSASCALVAADVGENRFYENAIDCLYKVVDERGFLSLFNGFSAYVVHNCLAIVIGSTVSFFLEARLLSKSSSIASAVTHPLVVIEYRMLFSGARGMRVDPNATDCLNCLYGILDNEGFGGLWAGYSFEFAFAALSTPLRELVLAGIEWLL